MPLLRRKLVITSLVSLVVFIVIRYLLGLPLELPKFQGNPWMVYSRFLILPIYLILFLILILRSLGLLIQLFANKKEIGKRIRPIFFIITIIISLFLSGLLSNLFFPDALTVYNQKLNTLVVDPGISDKDIAEIKQLASTLGSEKPLNISYYKCQKTKPISVNDSQKHIELGPKASKLCQTGDIKLVVGHNTYCGGLCGEYKAHDYLLRKVDGQWRLIEDLGEEPRWVS
ncbi:MAG: hypothetical protein UW86_C0026G0004 [Microgenomates group bacterium GW2011_GWA1_Microgenomates_45_10]|nr:MAG: hypothetical protein UW69_C0015G0022 [Microgenomates group bacterium GW2011_GWA2_44_7]KKT77906.1 MAG: hypothetical protein UW73_C0009G0005 [Microgenomates group bacterium GW2011_GWB1_44_8]KKT86640.1 MAG: hypothetical protein UW86_C0026G0004 [Microgenomates group bacterium GW2011_GWA1_Microgenomates_45_10]